MKTEKENIVEKEKPIVPKDIDIYQMITVRNGFQGKLIYTSSRTGETFVWDSFGSEQEIELRELRNAKNSAKGFFINNWFMFNDEDKWVIDYLGMSMYYKNAIKLDEFDSIFKQKPSEIKKTVSKLSEGQKRSLLYRAKQLIAAKEIDSLNAIGALEQALGVELIEH